MKSLINKLGKLVASLALVAALFAAAAPAHADYEGFENNIHVIGGFKERLNSSILQATVKISHDYPQNGFRRGIININIYEITKAGKTFRYNVPYTLNPNIAKESWTFDSGKQFVPLDKSKTYFVQVSVLIDGRSMKDMTMAWFPSNNAIMGSAYHDYNFGAINAVNNNTVLAQAWFQLPYSNLNDMYLRARVYEGISDNLSDLKLLTEKYTLKSEFHTGIAPKANVPIGLILGYYPPNKSYTLVVDTMYKFLGAAPGTDIDNTYRVTWTPPTT